MNFRSKEMYIHSLMCIIGGFFGAYAIVNGFENMGSAQTTNMIDIVCTLLGKNYFDFFLRILAFVLYITAIAICVCLGKRTNVNTRKYAITVEIIIMIALVFMPKSINPLVGLLPIFFMMSTQWSVFHGVGKYNSATIFSTNNLKQCVIGFTEYLLDKNPEQLEKGKFYGNSLIWFHVGVAISYFTCKEFGYMASLFAVPFSVAAFTLEELPENIKDEVEEEIEKDITVLGEAKA